ncbi:MAG TPA: AAA family ATPase [Gemmatales bacterium]|nr:AAA family ATPase [Gemmatales bacterium]
MNANHKSHAKQNQQPDAKPTPAITAKRFVDIEPKPLEWLWLDYIPLGTITLLDGNPDLGKSFLTVDLAARVSRGWVMPDEQVSKREPAGVILASAEDDPARTIRPRLEAAGADLTKVISMDMIDGRPLVLPDDLEHIERVIVFNGVKLLVFDPLFAFLTGKVDANKDHDIRRVLHQVKDMAERTQCAFLIVRHLNKRTSDTEAIYRGGGSIGILGASRSILLLGPHPEDVSMRVLARIKGNLSPQPAHLGFRFEDFELESIKTARLEWIGEMDVDVSELLKHHGGKRSSPALENAKQWLAKHLENDAMPQTEIIDAAKRAGISLATLKRAKKEIKVKSDKASVAGGWIWKLPAITCKHSVPTQEIQTGYDLNPLGETSEKNADSPQEAQIDTS